MHPLELFTANNRSFHVKKIPSQILVTFSEPAQFILTNSDRRIGDKKQQFVLNQNSSKNWKFVKNGSGCPIWNFLQPILDCFKSINFPVKYWSHFQSTQRLFEPIRRERSAITSNSLASTKNFQKNENSPKMVRGTLFGTICTQY